MSSSSVAEAWRSWTQDLTAYLFFTLFIVTFGPFLFGYHLAELNAPEEVLRCIRSTEQAAAWLPQCIPMDNAQFGLVTSIMTLGGLLGALSAAPLASKYGRVFSLKVMTAFLAVGPIAETLATNVATLAIGRVITGFGVGISTVVGPIYIAEVAPPSKKAFFGSFTQVMVNVGILLAQVLGFFLSRGQLWRVILAVGGFIAIGQFMGLFMVIESPRWAAEHGRLATARKDLQRLRGPDTDIQDEIDAWKIDSSAQPNGEEQSLLHDGDAHEIQADSAPKRRGQPVTDILTCIRHPHYRQATIAVMAVMSAQQLSGINGVMMYGVGTLRGVFKASSALINVLIGVVNLVATIGFAPLPDRLGRKPCLLASITGMAVSSCLLAIALLNNILALAAVTVFTFVGFFALGLGPIAFILSSELVGSEAVSATQSWALVSSWISTFAVSQLFPVLNAALGDGKVFFIFTALSMLFAAFIAFYVPETRGKRDADEVWGRKSAQALEHQE